jgi:hypothetical protein
MDFFIAQAEINHRKYAFIIFIIGLIIGLLGSSFIFDFQFTWVGYVGVAVILSLISVLSLRSFNTLSEARVRLTDTALIKISAKGIEEFPFSSVSRVNIKKTPQGNTGEIQIWFTGQKSTTVNGLVDFERFETEFLNRINKSIEIKEIRERFDFDKLPFYPVYGLVFGTAVIYSEKVLTNQDTNRTKGIFIAFSVYIFAVALYLFLAKPISSKQGSKSHRSDYLLGIAMFCGAVFVLLAGLLQQS